MPSTIANATDRITTATTMAPGLGSVIFLNIYLSSPLACTNLDEHLGAVENPDDKSHEHHKDDHRDHERTATT